MVKITGPAMSTEAAGKLAGILAFAKNKGRAYAKHTPTPADPKTQAQLANRAMMRFLQNEWAGLDDITKATWLLQAAEAGIAPYHAFLGANLHRWAKRQRPCTTPTEAPPLSPTDGFSVTLGGTRCIDVEIFTTGPANAWGCTVHLSADLPDQPRDTDIIAIVPVLLGDWTRFTLHEQPPGEWYILYVLFDATGNIYRELFFGDMITVLP